MELEIRIKILLVGDPGVGKSSFVQYLKLYSRFIIDPQTETKISEIPNSTIGVNIETIIVNNRVYELWDVSGSQQYKAARHIFYNNFHGIFLVHDLSNSKSLFNLTSWLREVNSSSLDSIETKNDKDNHFDMESGRFSSSGRIMPLLMVGTKKFEVSNNRNSKGSEQIFSRASKFSSTIRAEEIHVDNEENMRYFCNSGYKNKLDQFLKNCGQFCDSAYSVSGYSKTSINRDTGLRLR